MDPKGVKTLLKSAREAIRQKDFKEALKCCKAVLKADKDNYNALVFVGVAAEGLEQNDQAVKAFEKAIATSADQPLAWQGLCSFYEKTGSIENKQALIPVYEKLILLNQSDVEKKLEFLLKLADVCASVEPVDKAVSVYHSALKECTDRKTQEIIWRKLIGLLRNIEDLSPDQENMLLEAFKVTLTPDDLDFSLPSIPQYLKLLEKREDYKELKSESHRLAGLFPQSAYPLELLLQLELTAQIFTSPRLPEKVIKLTTMLERLNSKSCVYQIGKGFINICERDFKGASVFLNVGLKISPKDLCGLIYLCETLSSLNDTTGTVAVSDKALTVIEKNEFRLFNKNVIKQVENYVNRVQIQCWLSLGTETTLQKAVDSLKQSVANDSSDEKALFLLADGFIQQGQITQAEALLESHSIGASIELSALRGRLALVKGDYQQALKHLQSAIEKEGDRAEYQLILGRIYWEMGVEDHGNGDKLIDQSVVEKAFNSWLKAAKLNPSNGEAFLYLGNFYKKIQKDFVKARRCYQKSYDLTPGNERAGAALCDTLTTLGEQDSVYSILHSVTSESSAGSVKWAWLRLGLHQLKSSEPSTAVTSFQAAIRADPDDNHVWECLAEAYNKRGSLTAALKAFTRALELDPKSLYCMYQIASIKQTLGQLTEAIEDYKLLLEAARDYVPALKGLAETLILLARSHLYQSFNQRAVKNCTEAIAHLTKAASVRPDLSCLWKLLGDSCTILHPLAQHDFSVCVPSKLVEKGSKDTEKSTSLSKQQLLQLGARCYGQALKILPESASLWHDLGVNYFFQSVVLLGSAAVSMATSSLQILQKAVTLDPLDYRHWTALGRVACHKEIQNYSLAQHCFIKSIQAEKMNVVAWTNLGTLYLKKDNIKLAHEAFTVAQSLDPTYVACWIGQAMIAELVGHEDAMDLFRHTTELGNHLESALGYSHWVCTVMKDLEKRDSPMYKYCIEQMAAVPMATDALTKYLDRVQTNSSAYNMYGLLLEKQGLLQSACQAFQRSLEVLDLTKGTDEQFDQVRANYARVLCNSGETNPALKEYLTITTTTLPIVSGLALTYYKLGKLAESFQAYEKALDMCTTDEDMSHVYAAMGMVAYKFNDMDGVKTALFNCSQTSPSSNQGLASLCSFGFLQSDVTLLRAALQELINKDSRDLLTQITLFTVALHLLEGENTTALGSLKESVNGNEKDAALCDLQSTLLLQLSPDSGMEAAISAQTTMALDDTYTRQCLLKQTVALLANGVRNWEKEGGLKHNTFRSAQKAFHLSPDSLETLTGMIGALHAEVVLTENNKRKTDLLEVETKLIKFNLSRSNLMSNKHQAWLIGTQALSLMMSNKLSQAKQILTEIKQNEEDLGLKTLLQAVEVLMSGDRTQLVQLISVSVVSPFIYELLADWCIQDNDPQEADRVYRLYLQKTDFSLVPQSKFTPLIKLAHVAFIQVKCGVDSNGHWQGVFDEASGEVSKLDPSNSALLLMQALLCLQNNPRLSKRYLLQILGQKNKYGCEFVNTYSRKLIIQILREGKKDPQPLQDFLKECESCGDKAVLDWYKDNYKQEEVQTEEKPTEKAETVYIDQWDNC